MNCSVEGRTLFMHVGMPKTGTSAIQEMCYLNRAQLLSHGILYPLRSPSEAPCECIDDVFVSYLPNVDFDKNLRRLVEQTKNHGHHLLLSSESFIYGNVGRYSTLFSLFHKVYFIVYIGSIFSRSESSFSQSISTSYTTSNLPQDNILFLPETCLLWMQNIGKYHCIIKNYDKLAKQGNLQEDFFYTLGITNTDRLLFPDRQNVTLKTCYSFFLRHLANIPLAQEHWFSCVRALKQISLDDKFSSKYAMIPSAVWEANKTQVYEQVCYEAKILQDPAWIEYTYAQQYALPPCPYTQLPPVEQHRIFRALPDQLQNAIIIAYPPSIATDESEPILPAIYEDEKLYNVFFRWRRVFFEHQDKADYAAKEKEKFYQKSLVLFVKHLLSIAAFLPVYILDEKHGIVICQDIKSMLYKSGGLHIASIGSDPICFLPTIDLGPDSLCVVHICGTGPSPRWQLFYTTNEHPEYSEGQALNFDPHPTEEQKEGAFLILPNNALGSNLRLDVGDCAGEYCITNLKVYVIES